MRIFVLGDLHLPWVHWKALEAAAVYCAEYKPDRIVQVGDITDQHKWSRWAQYPDSPSADGEWESLCDSVERFRKLFPEDIPMTIVLGNHDRRYMMKAFEAGLPRHVVRTLEDLFPYENWDWHVEQTPVEFDGIRYCHGDETTMTALKNPAKLTGSIVHGHLHRDAGIYYKTHWDVNIFSMNVGTLMDKETLAGRYMQKNFSSGWLGWGTVTDGVPALFPYFQPSERKPKRKMPLYPHKRRRFDYQKPSKKLPKKKAAAKKRAKRKT